MIGGAGLAILATVLLACAAPSMPPPAPPRSPVPAGPAAPAAPAALRRIQPDMLCATHGSVAGMRVREPTVRAFARTTHGDAAELTFAFLGDSTRTRPLASGELRRQLGLKLRAANGCNLVYVMWRLDLAELEVQVKSNPGLRTNQQCGPRGYTRVHPDQTGPLPRLSPGASHALRAAIDGDELTAWIDGAVVWRGTLPESARDIHGPAGLRSDNVSFDILGFAAPARDGAPLRCKAEDDR